MSRQRSGLIDRKGDYKAMCTKGGMAFTHVNEIVQEVFEVTGFADILVIE